MSDVCKNQYERNTRMMALMECFYILTLLIQAPILEASRLHCGRGERYMAGTREERSHCEPCPSGFYQDRLHHRHRQCKGCQIFNDYDAREILVSACTKFHDIRFQCVHGFYRKYEDCFACTNCSYIGKVELRPCQMDQDTVCGTRIEGHNGRKVKCPEGSFFNSGECHACTDCIYLGKVQHRPCQEEQDTVCREKIVGYDEANGNNGHNGNGNGDKTSDTKCPVGFYFDEGECRICINCGLIGRAEAKPCGQYHNAICQEEQDFGDFSEPLETESRCKEGFYLEDGLCYACTNCASIGKLEARSCQRDEDAICF